VHERVCADDTRLAAGAVFRDQRVCVGAAHRDARLVDGAGGRCGHPYAHGPWAAKNAFARLCDIPRRSMLRTPASPHAHAHTRYTLTRDARGAHRARRHAQAADGAAAGCWACA
jgi:hypothetical protein